MQNFKKYIFEYVLVLTVLLLSIPGFSSIYFAPDAKLTPHQNLHVVTNVIWLCLLLYQLGLVGRKQYSIHRKIGLAVLFLGPWLVASTTLLAVHSAHKGVASGQGDFLIVQNVMGTLELGVIIFMAFLLKKKRELHGAFLSSTALFFMGIAFFFTLIRFVPQFKIEGPETFYRFGTAGAAVRYVCLFAGLLFFLKDRGNGWPLLLAGSFFTLNDYVNSILTRYNLIQPLTEFVGSLDQIITFIATFAVLLVSLMLAGITKRSHRALA